MPTYEPSRRFFREFDRLTGSQQARFMAVVAQLVEALRSSPPDFPVGLRVKRVEGRSGVWG